jgi:hypothetical protein
MQLDDSMLIYNQSHQVTLECNSQALQSSPVWIRV